MPSQFNTPPAFRLPRKPAAPASRSPQCPPDDEEKDAGTTTRLESVHRQSLDRRQESRPRNVSSQHKQESESTQKKSKGYGVEQRITESLLHDASGDIKEGSEDEEMLDLHRPLPNRTERAMYAEDLPLAENAARTDLQPDTVPAKRRRLDASRFEPHSVHDTTDPQTPSRPRFRHHVPATTLPHNSTNSTPMFNSPRPFHAVLSSTASVPPHQPDSSALPASRAPRFIVPNSSMASPSPAPNNDPNAQTQTQAQQPPPPTTLPDIFSPHKRKHERFVPGGWAAQVRNWVLDVSVASSGSGSRQVVPDAFLSNHANSKSKSKSRSNDEVEMVVRSVGMAGAGGGVGVVGMLRGEVQGKKDVAVVLVGEGGEKRDVAGIERRNGRESEGVREGAKVVLGLPAWEVDVDMGDDKGRKRMKKD